MQLPPSGGFVTPLPKASNLAVLRRFIALLIAFTFTFVGLGCTNCREKAEKYCQREAVDEGGDVDEYGECVDVERYYCERRERNRRRWSRGHRITIPLTTDKTTKTTKKSKKFTDWLKSDKKKKKKKKKKR